MDLSVLLTLSPFILKRVYRQNYYYLPSAYQETEGEDIQFSQSHVADRYWCRNLDPGPCDSRAHFFSPHILAPPEEAHKDLLEMKSTHIFGEKSTRGPHNTFPVLGPLRPWPYHILVDELPQVPEAMLLSNGVGVVAMLVGHTVRL